MDLDGLQERGELLVAREDGGLQLLPALLQLAQDEEVGGPVVATERLNDVRQAAAAAFVAQGGELFRVALAGEEGRDDGLGAHAVDIAEDMVDLPVHLGEHFLHELDLLAGLRHEVGPVPHDVTQRNDLLVRAMRLFEQTGGVELWQPLRVADVGLFARHAFDRASIDEPDVDAGFRHRKP
ncbi:MAG TPA: hypothetical protein VGO11_11655 [Chthoniobacteraceae bacterium]|nr:hypothetical protein [Chthoniobacteraceae bacterium]